MPKRKSCTDIVPRIYQVNAENILLFAWVNAQKQVIPTVTWDQAIRNYFKFLGIDDWDMESAMSTFSRLQKQYYEDCKSTT
jgi:hypothetical protein